MKMEEYRICFISGIIMLLSLINVNAQNPIITNQYTADPSARVYGDSVFLYPSHDILATEGRGRVGWFCMEDYHVFSSADLTTWKDQGVIVSQNKVPWVKPDSYGMWAPDCIYRNGKYYFYFPAPSQDTIFAKFFGIGVAVSDNPSGPYIPEPNPIKGVSGIDPCPFIDKDGQAYLYWAARNIYVAKLKENMTELASEPEIIANLPEKGLKEGPFLFERNGIYYLTYPHVQNKTECLEYAIGNTPLGPFKIAGVIMDESPKCWTNHQSFINFKNQWYLFYHFNDLSPSFDKNRSTRIDSLFFNSDGTIKKVNPTLRGVGLSDASKKIQIDRYSQISMHGVSVEFIDNTDYFKGWKTVFNSKGGWIQYNAVDFGIKSYKNIVVYARSKSGSELQLRLNSIKGSIISYLKIPKSESWQTIKVPVSNIKPNVQNLVLSLSGKNPIEVDWISFE